jgi:hypothetical protein
MSTFVIDYINFFITLVICLTLLTLYKFVNYRKTTILPTVIEQNENNIIFESYIIV